MKVSISHSRPLLAFLEDRSYWSLRLKKEVGRAKDEELPSLHFWKEKKKEKEKERDQINDLW